MIAGYVDLVVVSVVRHDVAAMSPELPGIARDSPADHTESPTLPLPHLQYRHHSHHRRRPLKIHKNTCQPQLLHRCEMRKR